MVGLVPVDQQVMIPEQFQELRMDFLRHTDGDSDEEGPRHYVNSMGLRAPRVITYDQEGYEALRVFLSRFGMQIRPRVSGFYLPELDLGFMLRNHVQLDDDRLMVHEMLHGTAKVRGYHIQEGLLQTEYLGFLRRSPSPRGVFWEEGFASMLEARFASPHYVDPEGMHEVPVDGCRFMVPKKYIPLLRFPAEAVLAGYGLELLCNRHSDLEPLLIQSRTAHNSDEIRECIGEPTYEALTDCTDICAALQYVQALG
ncbi:MAG: hypothetical protein ACOCWQ_02870 [Nanoarchaeota archaeon]